LNDLEVKATRADGTVGRVCKSVSGAQRQARLTAAPSGSEITSIKAGLAATFTRFGSTTAAEPRKHRLEKLCRYPWVETHV